jgi:hypothetical protein
MTQPINEIIKSPMSDVLIRKYFDGRPNIVLMSSISKMTSLNQIFRGFNHAVIFVSVNGPNDGHWQFMYKSQGYLHFFDSYGMGPTELLQKMIDKNSDMYGQNLNIATLILQSPYRSRSTMNNIKYQKDGDVQTCGRYVTLNFILLHIYEKRGLGFDGGIFYKILSSMKKHFKTKSYDVIVSKLIDEVDFNNY